MTKQYDVPDSEGTHQLPLLIQEWVTIPINLSDVYARLQQDKILNWYGFDEISGATENAANGRSRNFIRANNMYGFLSKNLETNNCDNIVNIVIPGLRNTYYNNRVLLPRAEQPLLDSFMKRPLPQFESIWNYQSLKNSDQIEEYQLFGSITPYDVVHIPVYHFVDNINKRNPISIQLYPLNIIINIVYSDSDLWDTEYQQIINTIDLKGICPSYKNSI